MSRNIYCAFCATSFATKESKQRFCSRSCATSYNNAQRIPRTSTSKQKTSSTIREKIATGEIVPRKGNCKEIIYIGPFTKIRRKQCTHCSQSFWAAGDKVTCSDACRRERSTYNNVKKQHIPYFNPFDNEHVHLHSNWEVVIADWLTTKQIPWSRPREILYWVDKDGKRRRYTPDFLIHEVGLYVDVKNPFKIQQEREKLKTLTTNYNLIVGNIEECKIGIMAALL